MKEKIKKIMLKNKRQQKNQHQKNKKKKQNPLDLLPPSKLELETFKRAFLNNKDKEDAMKKILGSL